MHHDRSAFDLILRELFDLASVLTSWPLASEYRGLEDYARGWFINIVNACRAGMLLEQQGLTHQIPPIRRLAVEDVVSLRWIAEDGEQAVNTSGRGGVSQHERLKKAAAKAGLVPEREYPPLDHDAVIKAEASKSFQDVHMSFTQRARYLEADTEIAMWLHETNFSHSSIFTALAHKMDDQVPTIPNAHACTPIMLLGIESMQALLEHPPGTDIAERVGEAAVAARAYDYARDPRPYDGPTGTGSTAK